MTNIKEFETEVLDIIPRTHNIISVRLSLKEEVEFEAGQYLFVTIKSSNKELSKVFSISSSPTEKEYIEFTKKLSNSEFSLALKNLKKNDWARLKLPFGDFIYRKEFKKIGFISGGIGITPIRSICKYAIDNKLATDIILLYSNHTPEDIAFREDLDALQKINKNLKIIYTITCPDAEQRKDWSGKTGYINEKMILETFPDFLERYFYLCGPSKMVEFLRRLLQEKLCIAPEKIIIENFTGY